MNEERASFHVGANCIVFRDGKVLLGLRKGSGEGKWGLPGGHLEWGERLGEAALRELEEETGLVAEKAEFVGIVNDVQERSGETQHRIQCAFLIEGVKGEPEIMEPDRCAEWQWFPIEELPDTVWEPFQDQLRGFVEGEVLLDAPRVKKNTF